MKFACPFCQGRIEATEEHFGLVVPCPHCGDPITVPDSQPADTLDLGSVSEGPCPNQIAVPEFPPDSSNSLPGFGTNEELVGGTGNQGDLVEEANWQLVGIDPVPTDRLDEGTPADSAEPTTLSPSQVQTAPRDTLPWWKANLRGWSQRLRFSAGSWDRERLSRCLRLLSDKWAPCWSGLREKWKAIYSEQVLSRISAFWGAPRWNWLLRAAGVLVAVGFAFALRVGGSNFGRAQSAPLPVAQGPRNQAEEVDRKRNDGGIAASSEPQELSTKPEADLSPEKAAKYLEAQIRLGVVTKHPVRIAKDGLLGVVQAFRSQGNTGYPNAAFLSENYSAREITAIMKRELDYTKIYEQAGLLLQEAAGSLNQARSGRGNAFGASPFTGNAGTNSFYDQGRQRAQQAMLEQSIEAYQEAEAEFRAVARNYTTL